MEYPTLDQVIAADHEQLCRWNRFLPSPGQRAISRDDFSAVLEKEAVVMDRICDRLKALGGFTTELSKKIGGKP